MKRFTFRLQRVLRVKRQRERQAELNQGQAQSLAEAAKIQLETARQQLDHKASELAIRPGQPRSAASNIAAMQYLDQLQRLVDATESRVREAVQKLHEAIANRARVHREVETLNLLHRAKWQEHKRDAAHTMQQQLDDLSMRQWQSNQSNHENQASL
jgi:flagellar export protein FliJ